MNYQYYIENNVILLAVEERSVGNDVKIFVVQIVLETRHVPNSSDSCVPLSSRESVETAGYS